MSDLDYDDGGSQGDGMPEPDWDRYRVVRSDLLKPAGDPLRWGARIVTQIGPVFPFAIQSEQFIRVQAKDTYSRSWSLIGTLQVPAATWADPAPNWACSLEISQGVGQATVIQQIDLRKLTDLGFTVYNRMPFPIGGGAESRSFAAIGALVGNAIAIRVLYFFFAGPAIEAVCTVALTPYAPGHGI